jgi:hypothetical protein
MKRSRRVTAWAVADEKGRLLHYSDYDVPNIFRTRKEVIEEIEGFALSDCVPVRVAVTKI